jgi:hypothetical protein
MSSDDEITKKIFTHAFDSEAPTKKTTFSMRCSSGTHEHDVACRCVCHSRPSIYHQRACCTPCSECGFRVVNPLPARIESPEGEEGDDF